LLYLTYIYSFVSDDIQLLDPSSLYLLHHVWNHGRGMMILCSFSIADTHSTSVPTWSFDHDDDVNNTNGEDYKEQREHENNKHEIIRTFFQRFIQEDSERFSFGELQPMKRSSVAEFLEEYFELDENMLDSTEFENVVASSGGIPLYAIELMRSTIERQNVKKNAGVGQSLQLKKDTMNHRIEEVIYYRLDQLDHTVQVLLKAAAVAASRSAYFNFEIISAVFKRNDQSNNQSGSERIAAPAIGMFHKRASSRRFEGVGAAVKEVESIAASVKSHSFGTVLKELVQSGIFIQLLKDKKASQDADDSNSSDEDSDGVLMTKLIEGCSLEFQIPIEHTTIYNLLVDDQKSYFHEKLAWYWTSKLFAYYSSHQKIGEEEIPLNFIDERLEEAFHWEKSYWFPNGILAYMTAADYYRHSSKKNECKWVECIKSAFKLFESLENDLNFHLPSLPLSEQLISFLLSGLQSDAPSFSRTQLDEIFLPIQDQLVQVLFFLEGFLDYLPVFIQLLIAVLDITVQECDGSPLIEYLQGLILAFIMTFYYCHLYLINDSNTDSNKKYHLFSLVDLSFLGNMKQFNAEDEKNNPFAKFPVSSYTSNFSLKPIYENYSKDFFLFSPIHLYQYLNTVLFAHYYAYNGKKSCSHFLIERKPLLESILKVIESARQELVPFLPSSTFSSLSISNGKKCLELQYRSMKLFHSFVFRLTIDQGSVKILLQLYEEQRTSDWRKLSNFNHIPPMLETLGTQLMSSGDSSLFHQIEQLQIKLKIASKESNQDQKLMFLMHGASTFHRILLLVLFGQPKLSYVRWQEYLSKYIEKEKLMKLVSYQWKKVIECFLKHLSMLHNSLESEMSMSTDMAQIAQTALLIANGSSANNMSSNSLDCAPTKKKRQISVYSPLAQMTSTISKSNLFVKEKSPLVTQFDQGFLTEVSSSLNEHFRANYISYESMNFVILFCQLVEHHQKNSSQVNESQVAVITRHLRDLWQLILNEYKTEMEVGQFNINHFNLLIPLVVIANYFSSLRQTSVHSSSPFSSLLQFLQKEMGFLFDTPFASDLLSILQYFSNSHSSSLSTPSSHSPFFLLCTVYNIFEIQSFFQFKSDSSPSISSSSSSSLGNQQFQDSVLVVLQTGYEQIEPQLTATLSQYNHSGTDQSIIESSLSSLNVSSDVKELLTKIKLYQENCSLSFIKIFPSTLPQQ
jgi:hypothetical protein